MYNPGGGSVGWTFLGNAGVAANGSGFNVSNAPDGNQVGVVQGEGTISQTLSGLTSGWTYSLMFWGAGRPAAGNYGGDQTLDVLVNGTSIGNFIFTSGSAWAQQTATFVATGSSVDLKFAGMVSASDQTAFIDMVTVEAQAVPEPATAMLLVAGGALVLLGRRRKA